jgi:23S rRNA pseudouridine1911/1915/1917 synthase
MREKMKVEKIFEDRYILVLNKPAGCLSLSASTSSLSSLEDWMREEYTYLLGKVKNKESDFFKRAGVVHRLDKNTSGLILAAKDEISFLRLQDQFKARKVKKKYWALVADEVCREGEIEVPIDRHEYVFGVWQVKAEGLAAKTAFERLKLYENNEKKYSLLELSPQTGRTHQIRVHLRYMGWPIVGDKVYGGESFSGLKRLFLQAKEISFEHPETGKKLSFKVELANDLKKVLESLERC